MRRAFILGISLAVVLAFMFFVPVAQITFSNPPMGTQTCTNSSGQLTGLCSSVLLVRGYGSITYWVFGTGGFYNTISSQYSFS